MLSWKYQDVVVQRAATVVFPKEDRLDRYYSLLVDEALRRGTENKIGRRVIITITLRRPLTRIVVPTVGRQVIWAEHVAYNVGTRTQLAPFVVDLRPGQTNRFTIEIDGAPKAPELVRAYPGNYMAPLPSELFASKVKGGKAACIDYWRTHAFVYDRSVIASQKEGGNALAPPHWMKSV